MLASSSYSQTSGTFPSGISTSSGSLKTQKGPSYSGLGVNSKSSISSDTISLLVMRQPWEVHQQSVRVTETETKTHLPHAAWRLLLQNLCSNLKHHGFPKKDRLFNPKICLEGREWLDARIACLLTCMGSIHSLVTKQIRTTGGHYSGLETRLGPGSQKAPTHLTINHIGNHHNLVGLSIWKLEGQFGCLNVKC